MQIKNIHIRNFIGARAVSIDFVRPVILLAGDNYAGKTSTRQAIRTVLSAGPERVALKKDFRTLVTDGATTGSVAVEWEDGRATFTLPSGKVSATADISPFAGLCIDPDALSSMDSAERRKAIYALTGADMTPARAIKRLKDLCNPVKVDAIAHLMVGDFSSAAKKATESASEARGGWKAVTGETYVDKKAEGWKAAEAEPFDAEELQKETEGFNACVTQLQTATQHLGGLEERARSRASKAKQMEGLRERAGLLKRRQDKLERDEAELKVWQDRMSELPPEGGNHPQTPCPECGAMLEIHGVRLTPAGAPADPEQEVKRKQWSDAIALYRKSVDNDKRDVQDSITAAATIAEIEASGEEDVKEADIEAATREVQRLKELRNGHNARITELTRAKDAFERASGATEKAARFHLDVQEWSALANQLSPSGIAAEIAGEALKPFQRAINKHAEAADWKAPVIGEDMEITVAGRPYHLLSKSEQWRANALLAVAVADVSGFGFVVLDEWDILNMQGRTDSLYWLAEAGIQALVIGTMKAPPKTLPEGCAAVWIENGAASNVEQAEEVAA